MCGLVGIIARNIGGFTHKQLDLFETMLTFDTVRGKDSTGVMLARSSGSADVLKVAEQPYFLFRSKNWDQWKSKAYQTGRVMAGHNRAATRGTINNANAHPFVEDHIIMMHNGTLNHGWESLAPGVKMEVDSNAIAWALAHDTPENVIPKIDGAFALLWYNMETEEFHAVRNSERPLHLITTDDFYFLASEAWMATIPCMRAGIKINNTVAIEEGDLYTWNLRGQIKSIKRVKVQETYDEERYRVWAARYGAASLMEDDDLGKVLPLHGEGKTTQVNFPRNNPIRRKEEEPRPGCALTTTTPKDCGSSTSDTSASTLNDLCEQQERAQSPITVLSQDFPKGMEVIAKIINVNMMNNGTWKWTGKIHSPGKELVDAMGFLDRQVSATELAGWMEYPIQGKVGWVTSTVGGLNVVVRECVMPEITLTAMGKPVLKSLWDYGRLVCRCRDCGGEVEEWEKEFTSIKVKGELNKTKSGNPLNVLEMVCANCIMKGMESGPVHEKFSKAYYAKRDAVVKESGGQAATSRSNLAVQDRQPIGGEPVGKVGSVIVVPGSETLQ